MPCYNPLNGWISRSPSKNGGRAVVFNIKEGFSDRPATVPCGQCIGCRLERSRQWAMRCIHEAQFHEKNCFITLTYSDEHLIQTDKGATLSVDDFQRFMKRLRKAVSPAKIRFFHCGEYGEKTKRPHYHAIIFGYDFPDKVLWKSERGVKLYRSCLLENLWPSGFSTVGDVTFESAAYVARYVLKKVTGERAEKFYEHRVPDYVTMSRRPGIAADWYDKFMRSEWMDGHDYIIVRGRKCRPPKFYDSRLRQESEETYNYIKRARKILAAAHGDDNTPERLVVKEKVKSAQLALLKRNL